MTDVLAQRKYRLAVRLSTDTAKTYGIALAAAFLALAIGSAVVRANYGGGMKLSNYLLQIAIPIAMIAIAWMHLSRSYPAAIAGGMTRKEFLSGFALFGAATILAMAVFTQLAVQVAYLIMRLGEADHFVGFYGLSLVESVARPALYFAVGAASAAVMHRIASKTVGAVVSGLMVGAVLYRWEGFWLILTALGRTGGYAGGMDRGTVTLRMTDMALFDTALAAVFVLVAAAVLVRAPMRAKQA